jgi:signal transduction histidine kinase
MSATRAQRSRPALSLIFPLIFPVELPDELAYIILSMSKSGILQKIRDLSLSALMIVVWLILGMVYLEAFIPPFDRLQPWLLPWKGLIPAEADLDRRLSLMQGQLEASIRLTRYALVIMIVSFAALSMYLSVVYQQKQRRARENMLLVMKNQEIGRRNEFIRYISATIGHEFKNNLGRIKRRIDLLPDLPPDAQERIDDNMDKLFADIDIFRKISDKREAGLVEFKNIDIKAMLGDLMLHYGDLADVAIAEGVTAPLIYAAPPLLKTVFENLIDNAIKYKKPDQTRAHIRVSCAIDSDVTRRYVAISFRDEGVGMDEQQADQCFYKGRTSGEGWGQGLYYAKYVIGLHAGKIRIGKEYTAPGVGTEIIIQLPFVEEASDV